MPGERLLRRASEVAISFTSPEAVLQNLKKKQFRPDLTDLHAVCDANYVRLLRLFPDYENCNGRELLVGASRVRLAVMERCRYTTMFHLHQQCADSRWLGRLRMEVRAYHDVRMLEVVVFQSARQVAARYRYPNEQMFSQDEKYQQNRFLADWLEHCLQNGRSVFDPAISLTDLHPG